jgi:hypothetical protein
MTDILELWKNIDVDNLERIFLTYNSPPTQSHVWCPLIWCALQRNGYDVPDEWCVIKYKNQNFEEEFNRQVDKLSANKNWIDYTVKILL